MISVVLFIYVVVIGYLYIGMQRIITQKIERTILPTTSFSIIIPFKNEADNLPELLSSIKKLNYPNELFEVLLIDDASSDGFTLNNYEFPFSVTLLPNKRYSNSPKKDAITTAVNAAKNDWLITTDADCIVPENWLLQIAKHITSNATEMIALPVTYLPQNGFLFAFQNLDFLSLQGVTIGSFGMQHPFMCNGANFAYTKNLFKKLNGFTGNDAIASGDDVFLLQKALQLDLKKVSYLFSLESIVKTKAVTHWKALFYQRVRWAKKATAYSSVFGKLLALVALSSNIAFVFVCIATCLDVFSIHYFLFFIAIKGSTDFIFLQSVASRFNHSNALRYFIPVFLLYPFFNLFVGVYSFFGKYRWKDRVFM